MSSISGQQSRIARANFSPSIEPGMSMSVKTIRTLYLTTMDVRWRRASYGARVMSATHREKGPRSGPASKMRAALRAAARDKSPYQQDEHCAHDASDEACSLTSLIPAHGLSEVGRD